MRNPFSFYSSTSHRKHARCLGSVGFTPRAANDDPPGLILVQIDGLSLLRFKAGIANGDLPYLASLLNHPAYQLHSMTTGLCCCASCPLAAEASTKQRVNEIAAGRPRLVRLKFTASNDAHRKFSWTRVFNSQSSASDSLAQIDKAVARIAKRAGRGSRRYELWLHARDAFAVLPIDAPLPRCCADEGAPLKPSDLRAAFEQFRSRVPSPTTSLRRPVSSRNKRILRVMTYDVHACVGLDGQLSPARIAQVIDHSGADVVCLQNLDVGHRSGVVSQAKRIESYLRDHNQNPIEGNGSRKWNAKFDGCGNAILSPFSMRLVRTGTAAVGDSQGYRRSILWVQVYVYGDTPVQFLNAHSSRTMGRRGPDQVAPPSVEQWIEAAATRGTTILCGDVTSDAKLTAYRSIASRLVDSSAPVDSQAPADRQAVPGSTSHALSHINHVFSTDDLSLHSAGIIATPLAKVASDHLPVQVGFLVA